MTYYSVTGSVTCKSQCQRPLCDSSRGGGHINDHDLIVRHNEPLIGLGRSKTRIYSLSPLTRVPRARDRHVLCTARPDNIGQDQWKTFFSIGALLRVKLRGDEYWRKRVNKMFQKKEKKVKCVWTGTRVLTGFAKRTVHEFSMTVSGFSMTTYAQMLHPPHLAEEVRKCRLSKLMLNFSRLRKKVQI